MKITLEKLDQYIDEMLSVLKEGTEQVDQLKGDYQKSKDGIGIDKVNYCIEKYVNSELDCVADGVRGLGRASEFCPRLGGYYRKGVSKLSKEKLEELDALITILIIKSYLFQVLLSNKQKEISKIENPEELYKKWIPEIYLFDFGMIPQVYQGFLFAVVKEDFDLLKKFFENNDMKAGIFSVDKSEEILKGYVGAGITMRIMEKS